MVATIKEVTWGITGSSGQLGRSLIDLLDNKGTPFQSWSHKDLDISDLKSVKTCTSAKIDLLVNCAAWTDVDGAESDLDRALQVNRDGARIMAIAAKELGIPLIHISTDYV